MAAKAIGKPKDVLLCTNMYLSKLEYSLGLNCSESLKTLTLKTIKKCYMKHLVTENTELIKHRHSESIYEFIRGGRFSRSFSRTRNRLRILSYKYCYHILYQASLESFLSEREIFSYRLSD